MITYSGSPADVTAAIAKVLVAAYFPGSKTPDPKVLTKSAVLLNGKSVPLRVFREWPTVAQFSKESAAGGVNIAVIDTSVGSRAMTGLNNHSAVSRVPVTVSATVGDAQVTFAGVGTAGQVIGVGVGSTGYSVRLQGGEDSTAIAALFAGLIPGAVSQGAILGDLGDKLAFTAGGDFTTVTEVNRQKQRFLVSVWAGDPDTRDAVAQVLSGVMFDLNALALPYGQYTQPPLWETPNRPAMDEKSGVYRFDQYLSVVYPTARVEIVPPVLWVGVSGINTADELTGMFSPEGPVDISEEG